MPLYLVRGPDTEALLIHAHDREELADILDEEADPRIFEVQVYDGPLCLRLSVPAVVTYASGRRVIVDYQGKCDGVSLYETAIAVSARGETGENMMEAIRCLAFPHFAAAFDAELDDFDLEEVMADKSALEAGLARDLEEHSLRAPWRDPAAELH